MTQEISTEEVLGLAEQPDRLVERLRKVAYGTTFLDVRADILDLIEREERGRQDQIAVCELLAKARAERDTLLASKARLEEERDGWKDEALSRGRRINELEKRR